jgi:hypothetical protein
MQNKPEGCACVVEVILDKIKDEFGVVEGEALCTSGTGGVGGGNERCKTLSRVKIVSRRIGVRVKFLSSISMKKLNASSIRMRSPRRAGADASAMFMRSVICWILSLWRERKRSSWRVMFHPI